MTQTAQTRERQLQALACAARDVLLYQADPSEPMTTGDLARRLERTLSDLLAETHPGRVRQLEKALHSRYARELGIVFEQGHFPQAGRGRPAGRRWRVAEQQAA